MSRFELTLDHDAPGCPCATALRGRGRLQLSTHATAASIIVVKAGAGGEQGLSRSAGLGAQTHKILCSVASRVARETKSSYLILSQTQSRANEICAVCLSVELEVCPNQAGPTSETAAAGSLRKRCSICGALNALKIGTELIFLPPMYPHRGM